MLVFGSGGYIVLYFIRERESLHFAFNISMPVLLYIVCLQLIYYLVQSWRFQLILIKCSGVRLPFTAWTKIFILGRFLNFVVAQLGNVYRGVQLKKKFAIPYVRYLSGFASMAWIDICFSLIIAILTILLFEPSFKLGGITFWKILIH